MSPRESRRSRIPKAIRTSRKTQRLYASPWRTWLGIQDGTLHGDQATVAYWLFTSSSSESGLGTLVTLGGLAADRDETVEDTARYLADLEAAGLATWFPQRQRAVFAEPPDEPFA